MSAASTFLRAAATENLGMKLIALIGAIGFFSLVRGAEDFQRVIYVDVAVDLPPPEARKILTSEVPDRVRLTVKGTRSSLDAISDTLTASLNLAQHIDQRYFYLDSSMFELPAGVSTTQIAPVSIPLTWADQVNSQITVRPQITGEVDDGLKLASVTVEPNTMSITGPSEELARLRTIRTEEIEITSLGEGTHPIPVSVTGVPSHSRLLQDEIVTVSISIVPEVTTIERREVEVLVVGATRPLQIRPTTVDLRVTGSPANVERLPAGRLVPYVDASSVAPESGSASLPVLLRDVPDELRVEIDPAEVFVAAPEPAPPPRRRPRPSTPAP